MSIYDNKVDISSLRSFCGNILKNQKNYTIVLILLCIILSFSIYNTVAYMKFKAKQVTLDRNVVKSAEENYIGVVEDYFIKADMYRYYSDLSVNKIMRDANQVIWDNRNFTAFSDSDGDDMLLPDIKIIGLIVLEDKSRVKLSIDGVPGERIFKTGDTFYSGKGKIIKINKKGVTWIWRGQIKNTSL